MGSSRFQRLQTGLAELDRAQGNVGRETDRIGRMPMVKGKIAVEKLVVRGDTALTGDVNHVCYVGAGGHTLMLPRADDAGPGLLQALFIQHGGLGALWLAAPAGKTVARQRRILIGPGDQYLATCDADGAWAVVGPFDDPSTRFRVEEDFHSPAYLEIGVPVTSGAGAQVTDQAGLQGRPGICRFETGTTTTGRAGVLSGASVVRLGEALWYYRADLTIPVLSAVTDRFTVRSGLGDSVAAESVDGVFFRYADNVNSGKWEAVCRSNSVETAADTGVTVTAAAWYRLEIIVNEKAAQAEFFINNVSVARTTSNIPSASGREIGIMGAFILKSAGTTSCALDVDLVAAKSWLRVVR